MTLTYNHALELLGRIVRMEERIVSLLDIFEARGYSDDLEELEDFNYRSESILSGRVNLQLDCAHVTKLLERIIDHAEHMGCKAIFLDASMIRKDLVELNLEIKRLN